MADQDAQDINQMMSAAPEVAVAKPRKSKFLWIVLGCVVLGVVLGVVVYQQSTKTSPTVKITPRPTAKAPVVTPTPTDDGTALESPVPGEIDVVKPLSNVMTFPETGKLRIFSDFSNIVAVVSIKMGSSTKTITIPKKSVSDTNPMHFVDSTFEVTAGSKGAVTIRLGSDNGDKLGGWILPKSGNKCGTKPDRALDITSRLNWAQSHLVTGKTIFAKQCWADVPDPQDPSSKDFNDIFLAWSYASSTTTSPSPSSSVAASSSPSPSPSASVGASSTPTPSPTPTPTPSPTPSPSVAASPAGGTAQVSPTPSPRAAMPDTTDGVPVTGVFEVTVGTISVGLILLVLGLFGLLVL